MHLDPDLLFAPADDEALAGVRHRAEFLQQVQARVRSSLSSTSSDHSVSVTIGTSSIPIGLDQRRLHIRRHAVDVRLQLVVDLDDRLAHRPRRPRSAR